MSLGSRVNRVLHRAGVAVRPVPMRGVVRQLQQRQVDLVLDVGAATGGYARELRSCGYTGRITSFEPLSRAFAELERATAADSAWRAHGFALGRASATATINVAANSDSSSLLPMLDRHRVAAPEADYVGVEEVQVRRLDEVPDVLAGASRPFLKIDAQGFEHEVLAGAGDLLERLVGVQLEISLVPLYDGALTHGETIDLLAGHGFAMCDVLPGFRDLGTGQLLQLDGVFLRT